MEEEMTPFFYILTLNFVTGVVVVEKQKRAYMNIPVNTFDSLPCAHSIFRNILLIFNTPFLQKFNR